MCELKNWVAYWVALMSGLLTTTIGITPSIANVTEGGIAVLLPAGRGVCAPYTMMFVPTNRTHIGIRNGELHDTEARRRRRTIELELARRTCEPRGIRRTVVVVPLLVSPEISRLVQYVVQVSIIDDYWL